MFYFSGRQYFEMDGVYIKLKVSGLRAFHSLVNHRWPKLGAQITTSFDIVLHITNDLKTLYVKFNSC